MKIIAFGHRQQVGKDTAVKFSLSHIRLEHHGTTVARCSFGDIIKSQAFQLFSWAGLEEGVYYENNPQFKNIVLPTIGKSPRQIWIELGNAGQSLYPKLWNELSFRRFNAEIALVSDLRKIEDIEFCRMFPSKMIRIDNPRVPQVEDNCDEKLANYLDWDFVIQNDGNFQELNFKIKSLVDEILQEWNL